MRKPHTRVRHRLKCASTKACRRSGWGSGLMLGLGLGAGVGVGVGQGFRLRLGFEPELLHLHVGTLLLYREPEPLGAPVGGVEELAGASDLGVPVEQLAEEVGAAVRPREHHEVPPVVPVVRAAQVRASGAQRALRGRLALVTQRLGVVGKQHRHQGEQLEHRRGAREVPRREGSPPRARLCVGVEVNAGTKKKHDANAGWQVR